MSRSVEVSILVNGRRTSHSVDPRTLLVHYLRDRERLTGTHVGCDTSNCGACTVMVDGVTAPVGGATTADGVCTGGRPTESARTTSVFAARSPTRRWKTAACRSCAAVIAVT